VRVLPFSDDDSRYMERALALAAETVGLASPNPQVGCVLVRDGRVIGEGAHRYEGRDHAEIVALKRAEEARGATAYVTLEPCSHHGRTGPCADALIAAGIARCVVATADVNPEVSGRGIGRMRAAGIEVSVGLLEARARELNEAFAASITLGRPFVTLKAGLSVDGRLAPLPERRMARQPFWLTGPESRGEVHRIRHASDVVMTGIGTVLADDPLLTDRSGLERRRPLMRVVLDAGLRIPLESKLVLGAAQDVWIFCSEDADGSLVAEFKNRGIRITRVFGGKELDLEEVLGHLHRAQVLSVVVEGGSILNGAMLKAELVDRATLFYAETKLGMESLPFAAGGLTSFEVEERMDRVRTVSFGTDICVTGLLRDPWAGIPSLG
jgi:diaminohydroxyphosphoribosylaminopyrimidine deaminase/5-amino-6-(5-phosphoribosylamino)uracil reductase